MDRSEQELNVPPAPSDPWFRRLKLVLAASAALRIWLAWRGGQFFWTDEARYYVARESMDCLAVRDYAGFFHRLLGGADHLFFKVLGLIPAFVQSWTGDSMFIPAVFFSLFSVVNIFLVWRIARAAGTSPREAFLAALLLACANTNFYYARHLLPYDAALTFGLLALLVGWSGAGGWRSFVCGGLAGLGFLTYNGYWLFGAVVLVGHVALMAAALLDFRTDFAGPRVRVVLEVPQIGADWWRLLGRALVAALGLAVPIAFFIGLARGLAGVDLVASFRDFSQSINQGDFGRGWKLMLDYFWTAERMNLVLGAVGMLGAVAGAVAARRWHYGLRWVAGALGVAAGLLLLSDVWHQFVIYGRTARQLVPLACLASAFTLERLWRTGGLARRAGVAAVVAVVAQAAVNFSAPLGQVFPPDFRRTAAQLTAELQAKGEVRQLVVLYGDQLTGRPGLVEALPDHHVLRATRHPLQFTPYLCEGFTEDLRELFRKTDIRMRLIALNAARFDHPTELRLPYPGVVQLTLRLPQNKPGGREPLVVTGKTGAGDLVYVIYESPASIRLGFDHWGTAGTVSEPLPVDYGKSVKLILSMGAMHEPTIEPLPDASGPPTRNLRRWLYAELNGKVVWSRPAVFHAAAPEQLFFGTNYIGGSTCDPRFTGTILKTESLLLPPAMAPEPAVTR